jgi:16S rRNA G966 N2-methylase RsmD
MLMTNKRQKSRLLDRAGGRVAVVYRLVAELKPDLRNPRAHSARQIRQIARSIETFGFNVPILADSDLKVIAGHARLEAAKQLGWSQVPTISLEHLTEAQARAFTIADNRLSELAEWNDQLLAEQLKELSALDLDFDLEAIGFDMGEIDFRIENLNTTVQSNPDRADTVPPARKGPSVTCPGDVWLLGNHRVCCGSALEESSYLKLMASERAAMVFSDPPYNVRIQGNVSGLGATHHGEFAMASGEMSADEFTEFLTKALSHLAAHSRQGSVHFICMDWRHASELLAAGRCAYSELKNLCVWAKDNAGMGSLYRSQHELVFVFKHGRDPHRNNVQLGQYGRNRTNVWRYPCANSFSKAGEEGNLLALHPTVKPVALVADAIMDVSARGEIVLDAFLGSGTTVIAAERTGRRCYGLEVDPHYVDVIIRRWQTYTGDNARHASGDRAFSEMEAEVESNHVQ